MNKYTRKYERTQAGLTTEMASPEHVESDLMGPHIIVCTVDIRIISSISIKKSSDAQALRPGAQLIS